MRLQVGAHMVGADVDREQPERRDVARLEGHEHARQPEDVGQPAREQRPRPPEGRQREVADVQAALDADLAQRVRLVPGADLEDAPCAPLEPHAQRLGEVEQAATGGLDVERDPAAEQVWGDASQDDVRVGDRRLRAALAVAERARVGAGRARAHLEAALGGDPRHRAAAGAHRDDVDHRDPARVGAHRALRRQRGLAVEHDGHVGAGSAAVEGEHLAEPGGAGEQAGSERARGRPAEHGRDGPPPHLRRRRRRRRCSS